MSATQSSSSSLPGIAILGAGIFAKEAHLPALKQLTSRVQLRAVFSRSQSSALGLATYAQTLLSLPEPPSVYFSSPSDNPSDSETLEALLARKDIGAVIVCLPITQLATTILSALKAHKHVLSEKPIAQDVATALSLIEEYNAHFKPQGLVWRVAEDLEAEPANKLVHRLISSPDSKIGKPTWFKLHAIGFIDPSSKWYRTPWRTVPEYQGGFLLDGGVHSVAQLRTILPSEHPIASISAYSSLTKEYLMPHDTIQAIVQTRGEGGPHGVFELSFAAPTPSLTKQYPGALTVVGSKGYVSLSNANVPNPEAKGETVSGFKIEVHVPKVDEHGIVVDEEVEEYLEVRRGVKIEVESFVKAVFEDTDDGLGLGVPENTLEDVKFIQAALHSNGQKVDLVNYS